jgi:hypothetical protein
MKAVQSIQIGVPSDAHHGDLCGFSAGAPMGCNPARLFRVLNGADHFDGDFRVAAG